MEPFRLGTRGSPLALAQATWVATQLRRLHPGLSVELIPITTRGDRLLDRALGQVGGKGLFVTEIETVLLAGKIDLAVHSLKDVPSEQPEGLCLAAFPERADPRDVLLSREGHTLRDLPPAALVGTSSLRRTAQLRHLRPDLRFTPFRGNVDTRLRKLQAGAVDALVLAAAGLLRLGYADLITAYLDPEACVPAAGQGILCLQARVDDWATLNLLRPLDCPASRACAVAERHVIAALAGSCQLPLGALATAAGETLRLTVMVSDLSGENLLRISTSGAVTEPQALAEEAVSRLREEGVDRLLGALAQE
ncbi:MAG: hydroxymethylbilane synthase [Candidatus Zipacnadales bacterium]